MSKTYKCIICLDHGFLAVDPNNPEDIITLEDKLWEEIGDRRLRKCECRTKKDIFGKGEKKSE